MPELARSTSRTASSRSRRRTTTTRNGSLTCATSGNPASPDATLPPMTDQPPPPAPTPSSDAPADWSSSPPPPAVPPPAAPMPPGTPVAPATPKPPNKMGTYIIGAVVLAVIAFGAYTISQNQNAGDLTVGQCFDEPGRDVDITTVVKHACTEPHDAEVFMVVEYDEGDTYPIAISLDSFKI